LNSDKIVKQLETLLDCLEKACDLCHRRLLLFDEAKQVVEETERKLEQLLPPDSTAFRIFDRERSKRTPWWREGGSGKYADQTHCAKVQSCLELLQKILNEFEPDFLRHLEREKTQFFLSAGEMYESKKLLFGVFKRASTSLAVIDGYLDDEVFDYIESLSVSISVRLLTSPRDTKPIFKRLYDALKQKRPNIEAKKNPDFHDRFLIIDASEVWHLGASINGAGKKAFMVNKVVDQDEVSRALSDYNKWWTNGVPV
jgi:hypothetical protein